MQQIKQFGFERGINLAGTARFWRIGQSVEATRLPLVKPTAHGLGMHFVHFGKLLQSEAFGRQQNGLRPLPQTMHRAMPMDLFKGGALRVRESRNELHAQILPESKIPGFFCTTT